MSVIGLTATVVQLIGTLAKTVQHLNDVNDATQDRARMAGDTASLLSLLTNLRNRVEASNQEDPWFVRVRVLGGARGPLDQHREGLDKLAKKLK